VNQLLNDMGDDPDQLPILQHALMRTWDRWENDHHNNEPLDVRHYIKIGRMAEALSIHADEAYSELPDERARELAEQIFRCLTERATGHRETRRPTNVRDIRAITNAKLREIVSVINVFREEGRSFVLPSARKPLKRETSIDISHESLIRNWTKLRGWVDREAQSANVYRRLVETAKLHQQGRAGLLTDLEVEYARNWKERNQPNLAWASRYHSDLAVTQKTNPEMVQSEPSTVSDQEIFEGAMAFLEKSQRARKKKAQIRKFSTILIAASVFLIVGFFWAMWQIKGINKENRLKARLAYGAEMNLAQREFEVANFAEVNQLLQAPKNAPESSGFLNRFEWYRWLLSPNDILKQDASLRGFEWNHLWALSHDESSTLGEYDCRVLAVASLNKPNLIATATRTRKIELWDSSKGNRLATPEGIPEDISAVAFAPDGSSVAIGKQDGSIAVEQSDDLRRTTMRRELATPQTGRLPSVNSIAYSPDGKFLAVGTQDGAVSVWVTSDFNQSHRVKTDVYDQVVRDLEPVSSVAFSSDSRLLAIGQQRFATLVDTTTWQSIAQADLSTTIPVKQRASTEPAPITCLAISPDGKTLAMGRSDKSITLWDLIENKYLVSLVGHSMEVLTVAFSDKEEGVMASGSRDGGIKVWDAKKFSSPDYRKELSERIASLDQKSKPKSRFNFSAEESMTTADMGIKSDSTISNELLLRTLNGHAGAVTTLAFLPNRKTLVSGSEDKTVKLWAVDKEPTATVKLGQPSKVGVSSLAFSPNGNWLAVGKYDGNAVIWNTRKKVSEDDKGEPLERSASAVSSVAFSPDGQILAIASYDKTVTLWQMSSNPKTKLRPLTGHLGPVLTMAFSPEGDALATGSGDKTVRLWDVKTGRSSLVTTIDKGDAVLSLSFAPNGRILAIGTSANIVILWDLDGKKEVARLERHSDAISSVAFSPDGSIVATGSWDGTAKLWDAQTGQELATLQGHSKRVLSLSFFPDGNRLVTGGEDGSVSLWDMSYERGQKSTRRALVTLTNATLVPAVAVAFSPDRQTLATGNGDGTVLLRYAATADQIARQIQPSK
jgi:WD40 repeat protein